jgi:hypothetical protein
VERNEVSSEAEDPGAVGLGPDTEPCDVWRRWARGFLDESGRILP